ncbi:LamG domain-containing protein [Streptomyces sp. NPDC046203]|uniref:LamG domain-containing protein n=1 Tax=Streptomyces sp. NPDC046203 TaxID=3154602 RepID=UPI00340E23D0
MNTKRGHAPRARGSRRLATFALAWGLTVSAPSLLALAGSAQAAEQAAGPTAPKPPVVTYSTVYQPCVTGGPCEMLGGPNQAGSFTFATGADEAVTHYQYKLSSDAVWSGWNPLTAESFTVDVTPPTSGTFLLDVRVKDTLNRTGETTVKFLVKMGSAPVGHWDFDEESGAAVDRSTDDPALRHDLTLAASGASRNDHGRRGELTAEDGTRTQDQALALTGASQGTPQGAAWSAEPVVDTRTSYTVTAWARPETAGAGDATVLSQDGSHRSAFSLGYCGDVRTWCVRLPDTDGAEGTVGAGDANGTDGGTVGDSGTRRVDALHAPQPGAWTQLGLVVDNAAKKLQLYVNGAPQGSVDLTAPLWPSTGGLQVGRAKDAGSYTDYFPGEIDEATVWQRPLSPQEMADQADLIATGGQAHVELVGRYSPAGATGSVLPDTSGYGNTLTLSPSASLDGESIKLNGADGFGSTERPLVDDTGSFTVATEVDVDTEKLYDMPKGTRLQVLGQQAGATGSSWGIWFEKTGTKDDTSAPPVFDEETGEITFPQIPVGKWHFGRVASDGTTVSVTSNESLMPKGRIGLTGVYDAGTRTISLYTAGSRQGVPTAYQATVGSGFTIGKDATGSHLPGRISDIRVWAGALTSTQQVSEVVGY